MRALGVVALLFPMRRMHLGAAGQSLHPLRSGREPRVVLLEREDMQVETRAMSLPAARSAGMTPV
jgi:hypothetical protein